jgi:hypothetical protein
MQDGLMYLFNINSIAQTICESLISQASGTPKGANPFWFRNRLPNKLTSPVIILGIPWVKSTIAIVARKRNVWVII